MSVKNLNQEKYSSDYNHFFDHDLWPFVLSFLNTTDNVNPNRQFFLAGNGASAAIASHLANDMTKALGCRARTFHDPAHITCFANDFGYQEWLAESIYKFVDEGDVVILISSGKPPQNGCRLVSTLPLSKLNPNLFITYFDNSNCSFLLRNESNSKTFFFFWHSIKLTYFFY